MVGSYSPFLTLPPRYCLHQQRKHVLFALTPRPPPFLFLHQQERAAGIGFRVEGLGCEGLEFRV